MPFLQALLSDRFVARWLRRALSIGGIALALILLLAGLPVWLLLAAIGDLAGAARRRGGAASWGALRTLSFVGILLLCELAGVLASLWQWLAAGLGRDRQRLHDGAFRLQCWWAGTLARAGLRCYSMRLEVEGEEAIAPGPILLLLRHASIGDTVLAGLLVSQRHDLVLRYVLKRSLLLDPCLDIVGHRLRNHFVRRGGDATAHEIAAVARLTDDLGPSEGVLIYPEGTRFTEAKRARVLERLEQRGQVDELGRARELHHVLPLRAGGVRALLERNGESAAPADVVFCSHAGFDGSARLPDLLRGDLVGRTLHVRFWRVPWAEVPKGPEQRATWLHEQWRAVDRFVTEHL